MAFIEMKNLYKIYGGGIIALADVNIAVSEGEFVVILGSSGAGKTTLLNIVGGMDRLTTGSYSVAGEELSGYDNKRLSIFRRHKIGFVFQFYNLMPNLTALENVQLAESVAHGALDSRDVLSLVGLSHRLNNFPAQLSGGEQQRVSIARAVVKNPAMLLCDEPTGALDSKTGAAVLSMLNKICKERNKTGIIVTHNAQIARIADRIIRLADGRVVSDERQAAPVLPEALIW
jgi:putative ABC transport system ATP-binding protein